ncbi:hypothetical protein XELAEV_18026379mg [Xenopus laevis]|uniref:Uncharacterized protein n=1 Tax=Xenopus laevis TaxID=8355 RepID=A0A974CW04_XENLA|nr:hypothetical protein XELAEV_18026379mg [Xenopus laevis]
MRWLITMPPLYWHTLFQGGDTSVPQSAAGSGYCLCATTLFIAPRISIRPSAVEFDSLIGILWLKVNNREIETVTKLVLFH